MSDSRVTLQLSTSLQEMKLIEGDDLKLQIGDRTVLEGSKQENLKGRFGRIMDLYNTFVGNVNSSLSAEQKEDLGSKKSHSINLEFKGALSQLRRVSDLMRLTFYDYVSANEEHLVHINIYKGELKIELLNSLIELENIVKDIDSSQKLVSKERIRSMLYYFIFLIMRLFGRVSPKDYHNKHYNYSAYRLRQNEKEFFLRTAKILGLEDAFSSMDSDVFSGLYSPLESFGVNFSSGLKVKQPKSFVEISADRKELDKDLHSLHDKIEVNKSQLRSEIQQKNEELKSLEDSLRDEKNELIVRSSKLARAKDLFDKKEKMFSIDFKQFSREKVTLSSQLESHKIADISYLDDIGELEGKYNLVEKELTRLKKIKDEIESRIKELENEDKKILGSQKSIDEGYLLIVDKRENLRKEYESLKQKISGIKSRIEFAADKLMEFTHSRDAFLGNYKEIIREQLLEEGWNKKQIIPEKIESVKVSHLKTYNANIKKAQARIETESKRYDPEEEKRMGELETSLKSLSSVLLQSQIDSNKILKRKNERAKSAAELLSKQVILTETVQHVSQLEIRKDVILRAIQCNILKVNIEKLIKEKKEANVALEEASQVSEAKLIEEVGHLKRLIEVKKKCIRSKESELSNASSISVSDVFEKDVSIQNIFKDHVFPIRGLPFRSSGGKMIRSV